MSKSKNAEEFCAEAFLSNLKRRLRSAHKKCEPVRNYYIFLNKIMVKLVKNIF